MRIRATQSGALCLTKYALCWQPDTQAVLGYYKFSTVQALSLSAAVTAAALTPTLAQRAVESKRQLLLIKLF